MGGPRAFLSWSYFYQVSLKLFLYSIMQVWYHKIKVNVVEIVIVLLNNMHPNQRWSSCITLLGLELFQTERHKKDVWSLIRGPLCSGVSYFRIKNVPIARITVSTVLWTFHYTFSVPYHSFFYMWMKISRRHMSRYKRITYLVETTT